MSKTGTIPLKDHQGLKCSEVSRLSVRHHGKPTKYKLASSPTTWRQNLGQLTRTSPLRDPQGPNGSVRAVSVPHHAPETMNVVVSLKRRSLM